MWTGLLTMANLTGVVGPFFPAWRTPKFRLVRTLAFVSSGAFCAAPVLHYALDFGFSKLPHVFTFEAWGFIVSLLFYVLGVVVYVMRIPERYFTLRCDSHQVAAWRV